MKRHDPLDHAFSISGRIVPNRSVGGGDDCHRPIHGADSVIYVRDIRDLLRSIEESV